MVESALKNIGLTDGEIRVYLALLELGSSSTGKITKISGISGSKVYEVLDRLIQKGLASTITKNNVKFYDASSPNKILNYLEEKKENIEKEKSAIQKIIPELLLKQHASEKSSVKVFKGWEGIKTANEDIIETLKKGEEWLSMGLTQQPKSWEIHFNKRQAIRAKKGIIHKHLLNEKYKSLFHKRKNLPHTRYKFLPKEFDMPTSTEIYKNKVIIMILQPEDPMAIMINSKHISKSFKKYFEHLWKST